VSALERLQAAPEERLVAFGAVRAEPAVHATGLQSAATDWDNRPSWDNWNRR